MKILFCILTLFFLSHSAFGQWVKQSVDTTASFRGLAVVDAKVVWASGTGGTVIRTVDGGKTWKVMTVPGAEKLDFRDIEAFDAKTAYILSIGNGESSRIYKTVDGGATWNLQFKNTNEKAFFDAIGCWDAKNCLAMSDPVDNKFVLIGTKNGGAKWAPIDTSKMPVTTEGEAAFAASGTCLITQGKNNAFIVSGGNDARVFRSTDHGLTWSVSKTIMPKGTSGSGIFSIAMLDDKKGVIVGGNYEKPEENRNTFSVTTDGGKTWAKGTDLSGYRSSIAYVDQRTIVAVGPSGSDLSLDCGQTWRNLDKENYNAVGTAEQRSIWAVGPKGLVANAYINPIDLLRVLKLPPQYGQRCGEK